MRLLPILLVLSSVAAGCAGPAASVDPPEAEPIDRESITGVPGEVGGSVANSAPALEAFAASATSGENRGGFAVVFTGRAFDPNTEAQIANLSVTATGPAGVSATHEVTPEERLAAEPPATYGADAFKVWTGVKNDGVLHFEFRHAFPAFSPAGSYTFVATAGDRAGLLATSLPVTVTLTAFSDITIDATPVSAAGAALAGQTWGQWVAEAGARDVASTNYMRLVNTGDLATPRLVIDFASAFQGKDDPSFTIPAADNVRFAWAEGPATAKPSELTFQFLPPNADGTVTIQFSGAGNVAYVTYQIVQLPAVLPAQGYGISFTATEI